MSRTWDGTWRRDERTCRGGSCATNVFSFTYPGYRQHYTSWLADTSAYAAWRLGGDVGIQTLQAAAVAAALVLAYLACRVQSAALPAMAILVLGFFVLEPRVIPRPHLASFAGIAACSWLIQRAIAARSARPLWWVVPTVALWSNLHLECVFGVAFIGLFALAEFARPSALARPGSRRRADGRRQRRAPRCWRIPYGWGLFHYLFENATVPQMLGIAELRPSLPPGLPRVLRVCGRRGAALVVAAAPARAVGSARARRSLPRSAIDFFASRRSSFFATAPMLASRLTIWSSSWPRQPRGARDGARGGRVLCPASR